MKIRCRGYEGNLSFLKVNDYLINEHGEPNSLYLIILSVDEKTNVELSFVKESEFEILPIDNKIDQIREKKISGTTEDVEKMKERYQMLD